MQSQGFADAINNENSFRSAINVLMKIGELAVNCSHASQSKESVIKCMGNNSDCFMLSRTYHTTFLSRGLQWALNWPPSCIVGGVSRSNMYTIATAPGASMHVGQPLYCVAILSLLALERKKSEGAPGFEPGTSQSAVECSHCLGGLSLGIAL